MKKLIVLSTLLVTSSVTLAQGGFQNSDVPQTEKPRMEMKQKHAHKGFHHHAKSHQGFFDENKAVKSIDAIKNAPDNAFVQLQGKIIKQVGKKDFIFQDATGTVEIEVSHKAWQGQTITPNDNVEIRGKIDKEWEKTEIEIKQIIKK